MKRGTLAKRLGNKFLRAYRIPFYNRSGNTVKGKNGVIHTKYMTSFKDFNKYFKVNVKTNVKDGLNLYKALRASGADVGMTGKATQSSATSSSASNITHSANSSESSSSYSAMSEKPSESNSSSNDNSFINQQKSMNAKIGKLF